MNWEILNKYPADPVKAIIKSRKISDQEQFLNPDYKKIQDPFLIPGMKKAIALLKSAEKNGDKIGLFMDYDADGLCGGSIVYRAISARNEVISYVPRRLEGYGLNKDAIDFFVSKEVKVLITVDLGIRNVEEVEYALTKNIKTIILDHHQLGESLPHAAAIVHPLLSKNKSSFKDYSGGGVAYMFARAYLGEKGSEKWLLDLAAISSIADIVSLTDDNRTLVKYGLIVLNKTKNVGLGALLKVAKIEKGKIGTYEVSFMIAPRINAPGRMGNPYRSFELLTTEDNQEANEIAKDLNEINDSRQQELKQALIKAEEIVANEKLQQSNVIILRQDDWNEGIIGLIAAKICEKFYRPTIAITKISGILKGSARSIKGVNITKMLSSADNILVSYGGHFMAAGLSVKESNYSRFKSKIEKEANKIEKSLFLKQLKVDAMVRPEQVNLSMAYEIEKFAPFGIGNPRPIFALEKITCQRISKMGKDKTHARLLMNGPANSFEAVSFNFDRHDWNFKEGDLIDIAFSIRVNEWNGRKKVDLILEDGKKS